MGEGGFQPIKAGRTEVIGVDASGTRPRLFDTADEAHDWLGVGEGLVTVWQEGYDDIGVSVHRADGVLALELEGLPDQPHFDMVAIRLKRSYLEAKPPWLTWLLDSVEPLAASLRAVFVIAYGDEEFAGQAENWSIHRSVLAETVPPVSAWLMAAVEGSALAESLMDSAAAADETGQMRTTNGFTTIRTSPHPLP